MRFCWMPRRRPEAAERVLAAMPKQDARGVLFVQGGKMTPLVEVAATGTRVWERAAAAPVRLRWRGIWCKILRTACTPLPLTSRAAAGSPRRHAGGARRTD